MKPTTPPLASKNEINKLKLIALKHEINKLKSKYHSVNALLLQTPKPYSRDKERAHRAAIHRVLASLVPLYRAWRSQLGQTQEQQRQSGINVIVERKIQLLKDYLKTARYLVADMDLLSKLEQVALPNEQTIGRYLQEAQDLHKQQTLRNTVRKLEKYRTELAFMHLTLLIAAVDKKDLQALPQLADNARHFISESTKTKTKLESQGL